MLRKLFLSKYIEKAGGSLGFIKIFKIAVSCLSITRQIRPLISFLIISLISISESSSISICIDFSDSIQINSGAEQR